MFRMSAVGEVQASSIPVSLPPLVDASQVTFKLLKTEQQHKDERVNNWLPHFDGRAYWDVQTPTRSCIRPECKGTMSYRHGARKWLTDAERNAATFRSYPDLCANCDSEGYQLTTCEGMHTDQYPLRFHVPKSTLYPAMYGHQILHHKAKTTPAQSASATAAAGALDSKSASIATGSDAKTNT